MRAGAMNRRVTLQRRSQSQDGSGGQSVAWVELATVWAWLDPQMGREQVVGSQVRSVSQVNILIRYFKGLTAKDRLVYQGRIYSITGVTDPDEKHRYHQITAVEGLNSG